MDNSQEGEQLQDLIAFFNNYNYKERADPTLRKIQDKCNALFEKDYVIGKIANTHGELCSTYPLDLVVIQQSKHLDSNVAGSKPREKPVNDNAQVTPPNQKAASTEPSTINTAFVVTKTDPLVSPKKPTSILSSFFSSSGSQSPTSTTSSNSSSNANSSPNSSSNSASTSTSTSPSSSRSPSVELSTPGFKTTKGFNSLTQNGSNPNSNPTTTQANGNHAHSSSFHNCAESAYARPGPESHIGNSIKRPKSTDAHLISHVGSIDDVHLPVGSLTFSEEGINKNFEGADFINGSSFQDVQSIPNSFQATEYRAHTPVQSADPQIESEEPEVLDMSKNWLDLTKLKEQSEYCKYARVWSRLPVPVIFCRNKNICRSAALSTNAEVMMKTVHEKTASLLYGYTSTHTTPTEGDMTVDAFDESFRKELQDPNHMNSSVMQSGIKKTGSAALNASTLKSNDSSDGGSYSLNQQRKNDVSLLKYLNVKYIYDLMVEAKKIKYFVHVCSSEKIDSEKRYADFSIVVVPYPGCEFFQNFKHQRHCAKTLKYDWKGHMNTAELYVPPDLSILGINWKQYRDWDLIDLTKRYLQLFLRSIESENSTDDNRGSGLLVHCISGWDRTPLFISLLRLSLWADGEIHETLTPFQILYLTIAYDWLLFGHFLSDRKKKGEEIFEFCFYFLSFMEGKEFSLRSQSSSSDTPPPHSPKCPKNPNYKPKRAHMKKDSAASEEENNPNFRHSRSLSDLDNSTFDISKDSAQSYKGSWQLVSEIEEFIKNTRQQQPPVLKSSSPENHQRSQRRNQDVEIVNSAEKEDDNRGRNSLDEDLFNITNDKIVDTNGSDPQANESNFSGCECCPDFPNGCLGCGYDEETEYQRNRLLKRREKLREVRKLFIQAHLKLFTNQSSNHGGVWDWIGFN